ncbi:MAG: hypothetical protein JXR23_09815 [Pontiellaceae bacterium]|nr:hypothetical protein [Pontiellaceae bacterium]
MTCPGSAAVFSITATGSVFSVDALLDAGFFAGAVFSTNAVVVFFFLEAVFGEEVFLTGVFPFSDFEGVDSAVFSGSTVFADAFFFDTAMGLLTRLIYKSAQFTHYR